MNPQQIIRPTAFPARVFTHLPAPADHWPHPPFPEPGDDDAGHDFLVQNGRPDLVDLSVQVAIDGNRVFSCDLP